MRDHITWTGDGDGYAAECADLSLVVRSSSPSNALDRVRDEIRDRVELCPCTSMNENDIELVVER